MAMEMRKLQRLQLPPLLALQPTFGHWDSAPWAQEAGVRGNKGRCFQNG